MRFTAGDIADQLGGKVLGDRTMPLTGFQAAARAGDLTFAENRTFFERAEPVSYTHLTLPTICSV